jgi:hypothetical protein
MKRPFMVRHPYFDQDDSYDCIFSKIVQICIHTDIYTHGMNEDAGEVYLSIVPVLISCFE